VGIRNFNPVCSVTSASYGSGVHALQGEVAEFLAQDERSVAEVQRLVGSAQLAEDIGE